MGASSRIRPRKGMTKARRGPVAPFCGAARVALSLGIGAWPITNACSHGSVPVEARAGDTEAPARGTEDPSRQGDVAVRFLSDPAAADIKVAETEEFAPASPRYAPLPPYPAEALRAGAGSAIVAIRLHLDKGGFVIATSDSPLLASSGGPHQDAFRQAAETAVRRWKFSSARIDTVAPVSASTDPNEPRPLLSTRYVPTYVDFAFQFSVVDGQGVVSLGAPAPGSVSTSPK